SYNRAPFAIKFGGKNASHHRSAAQVLRDDASGYEAGNQRPEGPDRGRAGKGEGPDRRVAERDQRLQADVRRRLLPPRHQQRHGRRRSRRVVAVNSVASNEPRRQRRGFCYVAQTLLSVLLFAACSASEPAPKHTPHRIVTLAPNVTEMVLALGAADRIVATDDYSADA